MSRQKHINVIKADLDELVVLDPQEGPKLAAMFLRALNTASDEVVRERQADVVRLLQAARSKHVSAPR